MRLARLFLTAVLAVSLLSPIPCRAQDRIAQSVVQLKLNNDLGFCSGFVIATRYVMTADHCMSSAAETDLLTYIDGLPVSEVWHDEERDVAIVELAVPTKRPPLRVGRSKQMEFVTSYGFPGRESELKKMIINVHVAGARWGDDAGPWLIASPAPVPGMSGGPIVDSDGFVVSLNQLILKTGDLSLSRMIFPIYQESKKYWQ